MASERTPLLHNDSSAHNHASSSRRAEEGISSLSRRTKEFTLEGEASRLIKEIKSSFSHDNLNNDNVCLASTAPLSIGNTPNASDLAIHLYALYILQLTSEQVQRSIRGHLAQIDLNRRTCIILCDRIEDMLDFGSRRYGVDSQDENDSEGGDEELFCVMWTRWRIREGNEEYASAIDLLLDPFVKSSNMTQTAFFSHPTLRYVLDLTWKGKLVPTPEVKRLEGRLKSYITPSRVHYLNLMSFIFLYSLTLALALRPGLLITPYEADESSQSSVSVQEVIWFIWASSYLLNSIQYPSCSHFLFLPTYLVMILIFFSSQWAYSILSFSILPLTFSLVFPFAPSLPILFPSNLLPLSIFLRRIITRSLKTAGLIMPLVLLLLSVFSWAMNGDVFRGFAVIPMAPYSQLGITFVQELQTYMASDPVEPGIAPFEARVILGTTIALLLLSSIILASARALYTPRDRWDDDDVKRWKGRVKEGDDWEREYGLGVARKARRVWAGIVRGYESKGMAYSDGGVNEDDDEGEHGRNGDRRTSGIMGREGDQSHHPYMDGADTSRMRDTPPLPPPLNILLLPSDIIALFPLSNIGKIRNLARINILGLICAPFAFVEYLYGKVL